MTNFNPRGFIRTEALIFIVIVFLGLVVVLFAFLSAKSSARDQQRLADVGSIQQALQIYFTENGFYPNGANVAMPVGMDNYLDRWPQAPAADGRCSSAQNSYVYSQRSNGSDYVLTFCLGASTKGVASGPHFLNSKGIQ
jgi:type II secretory pathway pseudopilin PulG